MPSRFIEMLTGKKAKGFLDTSFPAVMERDADLIVEFEDSSIFHLEIQTLDDPKMPLRMLGYYTAIRMAYDMEPMQMVLYVGDEDVEKVGRGIDGRYLHYEYEVRSISEMECRPLIESDNINDNILAALCRIEDVEYFWGKLKERLWRYAPSRRNDYLKKFVLSVEVEAEGV